MAYAATCRRDSNDRPVMGYANFCPEHVHDTANEYWQQFKTAKHEIAHALGFTSESWPLMRNSDGTQRTTNHQLQSYQCANGSPYVSMNIDAPSSNTIAAKTKRGKTVHMVVTERVKEVAKTYYECDSITGAELEDEVGSGCLGSHWEERTLFDELMSPLADSHFSGNRVSKFTLALFEDMGWYKANYSMADALQFGKKAGCDFLEKKCVEPSTGVPLDVPKDTFCSTSGEESCTFDLRGVGTAKFRNGRPTFLTTFSIFRVTLGKEVVSHTQIIVQCTEYTAIETVKIRRKIAKDKTDAGSCMGVILSALLQAFLTTDTVSLPQKHQIVSR